MVEDRHFVQFVKSVLNRTEHIRLANGLTILLCTDSDADAVAITLAVRAGYFDEPTELTGASHLVEHLFSHQLRAALDERAPSRSWGVRASTIYNHATYGARLPAGDLAVAVAALAEAFWTPTINEATLARERLVVSREAARKADSSSASIVEQLYGDLFKGHPLARWRIGSPESIETLTAQKIARFRESLYRPDNSVISIAGRFDPNRAMQYVRRAFDRRSDGRACVAARQFENAVTLSASPRLREERRDLLLARFVVGWRTPGAGTDETPLFDVLSALVAQDKLWRTVRERRLAWKAETLHYVPGDVGVFVLRGETFAAAFGDTIETACRAVDAIRRVEPSKVALDRAKDVVARSWAMALQEPLSRSRVFAEWQMLGNWRCAQSSFAVAMEATPSNLRSTARRWLHEDRRVICIHVPERSSAFALGHAQRPSVTNSSQSRTPGSPAGRVRKRLTLDDSSAKTATVLRTASGSPVLVAPIPTADGRVSVGLYVSGGKADELPADAGITNALVMSLMRSNWLRGRPRLAQSVREMDFILAPVIGLDYFGWSVLVEPRYVRRAMNLLCEFMHEASVSEEAIEAQRFRALGSLAAAHESAPRTSLAVALRSAYQDHSYGVPDHGSVAAVDNLTVASITSWRRRMIGRPRLVFAAIGPITAAAVSSGAFDLDCAIDPETPLQTPRWPSRPVDGYECRAWRESGLSVLFPLPGIPAMEGYLHDVLATLVGGVRSRLVNELRIRRALCYVATGIVRARQLSGAIGFYAETAAVDIAECRQTIVAEFRRITCDEIDESELQVAKAELLGRWHAGPAIRETRKHQLLLSWFFRTLESYDYYPQQLRDLSVEGVSRAVRECIDSSIPVTGLVGQVAN